MSTKDWKKRLGTVYSTNPDFKYETENDDEQETPENSKQQLLVFTDSKQRKGKIVSIVTGFVGNTDDLEIVAKSLKTKCGVGGSVKDGEIIIQGDFKLKIKELLEKEGYKVKTR